MKHEKSLYFPLRQFSGTFLFAMDHSACSTHLQVLDIAGFEINCIMKCTIHTGNTNCQVTFLLELTSFGLSNPPGDANGEGYQQWEREMASPDGTVIQSSFRKVWDLCSDGDTDGE